MFPVRNIFWPNANSNQFYGNPCFVSRKETTYKIGEETMQLTHANGEFRVCSCWLSAQVIDVLY